MKPKLSVCVITYNHEKYLAQCLDSIISQKCNAPFEIIIGEDKSTDSTTAIVEQYQKKYPELISVITDKENVGMVQNWRRTINACRGEYAAIIEGDDFWTSDLKLQKQIDLMDAHKEYALSFHDVDVTFGEGVPQIDSITRFAGEKEFTIQDVILRNWFIPTCSMVVRKSMMSDFPDDAKKLNGIDMIVQLLASSNGNIGYIAEKLGTYRIHIAGQSQVLWLGKENTIEFTIIDMLQVFDRYSKGKYRSYIHQRLERSYRMLLVKNSPWSKYYFKAMFGLVSLNPRKNISVVKAWFIINCIPERFYKIYRSIKH